MVRIFDNDVFQDDVFQGSSTPADLVFGASVNRVAENVKTTKRADEVF